MSVFMLLETNTPPPLLLYLFAQYFCMVYDVSSHCFSAAPCILLCTDSFDTFDCEVKYILPWFSELCDKQKLVQENTILEGGYDAHMHTHVHT